MRKILFVCHGNICRSPMAEFIFKHLLKDAGLLEKFEVDSAGTSSEEVINGVGNPIYPPVKKLLEQKGIEISDKRARQINMNDYDLYDLLVAFDKDNLKNLKHKFNPDSENKIHMLLEYSDNVKTKDADSVADPWYTRDFTKAYEDILKGCEALLSTLLEN